MKLLFIVFVPIIGAFLLPLAGIASKTLRNLFALFIVLVPLVLSVTLIQPVFSSHAITAFWQLPLGFNFFLRADRLALFMALVSSFLSLLILIYSFDYISHYENQNEYYLMVVFFLGSMMGLIFSANLIFLYIFWEMTGIASWRLIGFFREKDDVVRANKSFLITVFGALLMLIGFIILYQQAGSFDLPAIKEAMANRSVSNIAVLLILAGIFSKSAVLPFHTWLPDAGVAPSPVTALLHAAILVKIGVYVFARLFIAVLPLGSLWHTVVPAIAGVSAIVSAGAAFVEKNIKRIVAYSTISQISFIFLGFACGNVLGIAGGLLYILMHGLAKAGLFLCAGIIEQNTKTKDITKMGGLFSTMPVTAIAFLFCAFSVMGIPPFGGFFSKFMVMSGAIGSVNPWIVSVFIIGAFMTILYLLRAFSLIFLGEAKIQAKEGSSLMVACVAIFAILSLAGGIFIKYPSLFVQKAVEQMTMGQK